MKTIQRVIFICFLTVFFIPSLSVFGDTDVNQVQIILHKRLFIDEKPGLEVLNTGEVLEFGGEPFQGVEFTVYDVTQAYDELLNQKKTAEEAAQTIAENVDVYTNLKVTKGITDGQGEIHLNLAKKIGQKDAVYLFLETGWPKEKRVKQKAAPIVLALPIYQLNTDGTFSNELLKQIHLYPKNIGESEKTEPEDPKPFKPKPIKPSKPSLPQTGEAKSLIGLLGVLLVSMSLYFWKKRRMLTK